MSITAYINLLVRCLVAIYGSLVGVSVPTITAIRNGVSATGLFVRRFVLINFGFIVVTSIIMAAGIYFECKSLTVICAALVGVASFILWGISNRSADLLAATLGQLPYVGNRITLATDELKKLTDPILVIGMAYPLIGNYFAIRGFGHYHASDVLIIGAYLILAYMFTLYIKSTRKLSGYVMMLISTYMMIGYYVWPLQIQSIQNLLYRASLHASATLNTKEVEGDLISIKGGETIYKINDDGSFSSDRKTETEIKAKLVNEAVEDSLSGEKLYKVILCNEETKNFIGGKFAYVLVRQTTPVMQKTDKTGTGGMSVTPPKLYTPGAYSFQLKAGEESEWISFTAPRQNGNNYTVSSKDYNYKIIYDDGVVIKDGPNVIYPNRYNVKMKILALSNEEVLLTIN